MRKNQFTIAENEVLEARRRLAKAERQLASLVETESISEAKLAKWNETIVPEIKKLNKLSNEISGEFLLEKAKVFIVYNAYIHPREIINMETDPAVQGTIHVEIDWPKGQDFSLFMDDPELNGFSGMDGVSEWLSCKNPNIKAAIKDFEKQRRLVYSKINRLKLGHALAKELISKAL